jgi:uncharacterized protein YbjT (DUF2867 family)
MKVVVIGGSGLIGSQLVNRLRQGGHEVLAASPDSGVNTITGEGLATALQGAQVVADVANSPSFEDHAVMEFFETSGHNLLAAEKAAGVRLHVGALRRRDGTSAGQRLFPCKVGPGKIDPGLGRSLHHRPFHAIL